jgi:hypothetical protein
VHDHPSGRQLRHARTCLTHHAKASFGHVVVADVTPTAGPFHTVTNRGTRAFRTAPAAVLLQGSIPWSGAAVKIFWRLTGATGIRAVAQALSTGSPREAARMVSLSCVRAGR